MIRKYGLEEIGEEILASKGTYVICVDIDDMIGINEKHSYAGGDAAIAETAARIGKSIDSEMNYYRIGADSFVVLTKSNDLPKAEKVAQSIIDLADSELTWSGGTFRFTLTMGITRIPLDLKDAKETLDQAEKAMIAAKNEGRNCYKVL